MKYTIVQIDKKTTQTGRPFARVSLKDETGQVMDNVSVWPDYPAFNDLQSGGEVAGSVETNAKGFRYLKTADLAGRAPRQAGSDMQVTRSRAQEDYRAEVIRKAQDRKNESIAYFNAVNAAITLVSSLQPKLMGNFNRSILKQEIDYWRDWFLDEWKKHDIDMRYRVNPA